MRQKKKKEGRIKEVSVGGERVENENVRTKNIMRNRNRIKLS